MKAQIKIDGLFVAVVAVVVVGGGVYLARKKITEKINPASSQNIVQQALTPQGNKDIGDWLYCFTHSDASPDVCPQNYNRKGLS